MFLFRRLTDPALKRLYKFVLKRLVGRFLLHELDLDQLDVQLRAGSLELHDLSINVQTLNDELGAVVPFRATSGYVGCVKIEISYGNLLKDSCKITLDDVEIVVAPFSPSEETDKEKSKDQKKFDVGPNVATQEAADFEIDPNSQEGLDFVAGWIEQVSQKIKVSINNLSVILEDPLNSENAYVILRTPFVELSDQTLEEPPSRDSLNGGSISRSMFNLGIVQKAIRLHGFSVELHQSRRNESDLDSTKNTLDAERVVKIISTAQDEQALVQLKLSQFQDRAIPDLDVDVFLQSLQLTIEPTSVRQLHAIILSFTEGTTQSKETAYARPISELGRSELFTDALEDAQDSSPRTTGENDWDLSAKEFQRIERLLKQYAEVSQTLKKHQESARFNSIVDSVYHDSYRPQEPKTPQGTSHDVSLSHLDNIEEGLSDAGDFFDFEEEDSAQGHTEEEVSQSFMGTSMYMSVAGPTQGGTYLSHIMTRVKFQLVHLKGTLLYKDLRSKLGGGGESAQDEERLSLSLHNLTGSLVVTPRNQSLHLGCTGMEFVEYLRPVLIPSGFTGRDSLLRVPLVIFLEENGSSGGAPRGDCLSVSVGVDYELRVDNVGTRDGRTRRLSTTPSELLQKRISMLTVDVHSQPFQVDLDLALLGRLENYLNYTPPKGRKYALEARDTGQMAASATPEIKMMVTSDSAGLLLRFPLVSFDRSRASLPSGPLGSRGLCEDTLKVSVRGLVATSSTVRERTDANGSRTCPTQSTSPLNKWTLAYEQIAVHLLYPDLSGDQSGVKEDDGLVGKEIARTATTAGGNAGYIRLEVKDPAPFLKEVDPFPSKLQPLPWSRNRVRTGESRAKETHFDREEGSKSNIRLDNVEHYEHSSELQRLAYRSSQTHVEVALDSLSIWLDKADLERVSFLFSVLSTVQELRQPTPTVPEGTRAPTFMSLKLSCREGSASFYDHVKNKGQRQPGGWTKICFEQLSLFQISQWLGSLVSHIQIAAEDVSLLEYEKDSPLSSSSPPVSFEENGFVGKPVLYKTYWSEPMLCTPAGQKLPLMLLTVEIDDSKPAARDVTAIMGFNSLSLRYDIYSLWLNKLLDFFVIESQPTATGYYAQFPFSQTTPQCLISLPPTSTTYLCSPMELPLKTVFTKLYVTVNDAAIDYNPTTLPSRIVLGTNFIRVTANLVSGASIQGFKVSVGDSTLFITDRGQPYTKEDRVLCGGTHAEYRKSFLEDLGRFTSLQMYLEQQGYIQICTLDFLDIFIRSKTVPLSASVEEPVLASTFTKGTEEGLAEKEIQKSKKLLASPPDVAVELSLGTLNLYTCFDSCAVLLAMVSDASEKFSSLSESQLPAYDYVGVGVTHAVPIGTDVGLSGDEQKTAMGSIAGSVHAGTPSLSILESLDTNAFEGLPPSVTNPLAVAVPVPQSAARVEARASPPRPSGPLANFADDSLSASELRAKYGGERPTINVSDVLIEDYYTMLPGTAVGVSEQQDSPHQHSRDYTEGGDEGVARWITDPYQLGSSTDKFAAFEPLDSDGSEDLSRDETADLLERTAQEEMKLDETDTPPDFLPSLAAFNAKPGAGGQGEYELSDLRAAAMSESGENSLLDIDIDRDRREGGQDYGSVSMLIDEGEASGTEVQLDFALDSELTRELNKMLDRMEPGTKHNVGGVQKREEDDIGKPVKKDEKRQDEVDRTRDMDFWQKDDLGSSEPSARWYQTAAEAATSSSETRPLRIYPHHIQIPPAGAASALSFGEREFESAVKSTKGTQAPRIQLHLLLRNLNVRWKLFAGNDFNHAPEEEKREQIPTMAEQLQKSLPKSAAKKDRKSLLLDTLLDNYVAQDISGAVGAEDNISVTGDPMSQSIMVNRIGDQEPHLMRVQSRKPSFTDAKKRQSVGRKTEQMIEILLQQVQARLDVCYRDVDHQLNLVLTLGVRDFGVLDCISTSMIRRMLSYWKSETKHPREEEKQMLLLGLLSVRPGPNLADEFRLKVQLLPLRINLDQNAIQFLRSFFPAPRAQGTTGTADDGSKAGPLGGIEVGEDAHAKRRRESSADAPSAYLFFQSVDVKAIKIKIDYQPESVDFGALRAGDYLELLNLFPLEGMELVLKAVSLSGVDGLAGLGEAVGLSWVNDIARRQIHKCLASVSMPPVRAMSNIGAGAADLILLPMEQYSKDRRIVKGLARGAKSFLKNITVETLNTATKVSQVTQTLLQHAEDIVSGDSSASSKRNRHKRHSRRSRAIEQPANVSQGFSQAYDSLSKGVQSAAHTIVAVPIVEYRRTGTGGYVKSVIRAVPIAVIRPMIGASEALSTAITGLRNVLDPEAKEDMMNKYKSKRKG